MIDLDSLAVALGADVQHLHRAVLAGDPVAKGRPRMTRTGHAYTPSKTRHAEHDLAWMLRAAGIASHALVGPVVLVARFYRKTHRRADVDNFSKLLLDAGTKAGLWGDDSQIVAHATLMAFDKADPRTELVWGPTVA